MSGETPRARLARYVTAAITVVWMTTMVADIFVPTYEPSPFVHAAMGAVIAALFGQTVVRNK